jgi:hypothetical protein
MSEKGFAQPHRRVLTTNPSERRETTAVFCVAPHSPDPPSAHLSLWHDEIRGLTLYHAITQLRRSTQQAAKDEFGAFSDAPCPLL